ncbi:hypothetical protein [Rhizobium vallis]|nr:hypothetical protein [Rhizobium vallis]
MTANLWLWLAFVIAILVDVNQLFALMQHAHEGYDRDDRGEED